MEEEQTKASTNKTTQKEQKKSEKDKSKELYIYIDFKKGAKFEDESGALCDVHDTTEKTWRHLNFFQHACYITCRVPRINTTEGKQAQQDSFSIRRSALQGKVYNTTTLNGADAVCQALAIKLPMDVYRLQDLQTVG